MSKGNDSGTAEHGAWRVESKVFVWLWKETTTVSSYSSPEWRPRCSQRQWPWGSYVSFATTTKQLNNATILYSTLLILFSKDHLYLCLYIHSPYRFYYIVYFFFIFLRISFNQDAQVVNVIFLIEGNQIQLSLYL